MQAAKAAVARQFARVPRRTQAAEPVVPRVEPRPGTARLRAAVDEPMMLVTWPLPPMSTAEYRMLEIAWGKIAGAYGQLSQTRLQAPMEALAGRRTFELGGTARFDVLGGKITGRAGLLLPAGNDDTSGFVASTAGVAQRPTDAAASFSSSVSTRTSASFVTTGERSVLQVDAGVDWLLGTETRAVDALVRANAGVGLGTRRAMLTIELSNALRVSERTRLHALVIGGLASIASVSVGLNVSITHEAAASVLTSVSYDL